jgi:hypothetical protein
MTIAEIDTQTEPTNFETNSHEYDGFETADELASGTPITLSDPTAPDEKLIKLLESYEILKDRMDALQAERNVMREEIQSHMAEAEIGYSEVPVPTGRAYKVSLSNRIMETVTREGKSFIKVHATPELLDSLIRTTERETLAIREMTGVPRQSLFNRLQDD